MLFTKKISEWVLVEKTLAQAKNYPGLAFQIWCLTQQRILNRHLDIVREKSTPDKLYVEYVEKGIEIQKRYCGKDSNGNAVIIDTPQGPSLQFSPKNKAFFDADISSHNEQSKDVISDREKQLKEYDEYVDSTDQDFDLKLLNKKNIPEKFFEEHPDKSLAFITYCLDLTDLKDDQE